MLEQQLLRSMPMLAGENPLHTLRCGLKAVAALQGITAALEKQARPRHACGAVALLPACCQLPAYVGWFAHMVACLTRSAACLGPSFLCRPQTGRGRACPGCSVMRTLSGLLRASGRTARPAPRTGRLMQPASR